MTLALMATACTHATLLYKPNCLFTPTILVGAPIFSIGTTNRRILLAGIKWSKFAPTPEAITLPKGETAAVSVAGIHLIASPPPPIAPTSNVVVLSVKVTTEETVTVPV